MLNKNLVDNYLAKKFRSFFFTFIHIYYFFSLYIAKEQRKIPKTRKYNINCIECLMESKKILFKIYVKLKLRKLHSTIIVKNWSFRKENARFLSRQF